MIKKKIETKKIEFLNTHIAGFSHWDGCEVFSELKVGEELYLVLEPNNPYDKHAIAIYRGNTKLGYIPRCDNYTLWLFLYMDHADLFKVRINRITPDVNPESQIGISVMLLKNETSTTFVDFGDNVAD